MAAKASTVEMIATLQTNSPAWTSIVCSSQAVKVCKPWQIERATQQWIRTARIINGTVMTCGLSSA